MATFKQVKARFEDEQRHTVIVAGREFDLWLDEERSKSGNVLWLAEEKTKTGQVIGTRMEADRFSQIMREIQERANPTDADGRSGAVSSEPADLLGLISQ